MTGRTTPPATTRARDWYAAALARGSTVVGEPYMFFSTHRVGLTISEPMQGTRNAVGADIRLESLGNLFGQMKTTPGTQLALSTPDGRIFAHEDIPRLLGQPGALDAAPRLRTLAESGVPVLQALQADVQASAEGTSGFRRLHAGGRDWSVSIAPVEVRGGLRLRLVIAVPDDELLAEAQRQQLQAAAFALLADQLRARLRELDQRLATHHGGDSRVAHAHELLEQDFDDAAQHAMDREVDLGLSDRDTRELDALGRALARVHAGGYGTCTACDAPIPFERLKAEPQAERCVPCEAALEARQALLK